jgi:hypothetical protein
MGEIKCQDKDGVNITCSDDCWENHIVAEHPEMEGWDAYVKVTIEKPYQIYQDGRHPKRKAFYNPFILPKPFHQQYLRVVVEYKKRRFASVRGYVITAFPCQGIRKGDILIWERQI